MRTSKDISSKDNTDTISEKLVFYLPLKFPENMMASRLHSSPVLFLEDSWKCKVLLDASPSICSAHFLRGAPPSTPPAPLELQGSKYNWLQASWLLQVGVQREAREDVCLLVTSAAWGLLQNGLVVVAPHSYLGTGSPRLVLCLIPPLQVTAPEKSLPLSLHCTLSLIHI